MRVYVVMGNDYPAAVFSSEAGASAYCDAKKAQEPKPGELKARIHWTWYEFELDKPGDAA